MSTLYEMTVNASKLYDLLLMGEIDEQTFNDTLESIGADEKINSYCEIINQFKADMKSLKDEINRLTERKNNCENAIERMKSALDEFMKASGKTKEKTDKFTIFYRDTQSVNILDENKLPDEYLTPQPPKIDKKAISAAIKGGEKVDGAELVTKSSINIR